MSKFTVIPAIDLRNGKVVRLAQGDPDRQTIYGDDPLAWADRWQSEQTPEGLVWRSEIKGDPFEINLTKKQIVFSSGSVFGTPSGLPKGIREFFEELKEIEEAEE